MDETCQGLVLRMRPLTETSLIIHWFTEELGRLTTVAKGARRMKSPFRGKVDLYYLAEFSFARSRRSDLHTLREVKLIETHEGLRLNLEYLRQAAYCATLLEQNTEPENAMPGLFRAFAAFLRWLPLQPPGPIAVLAWEMKFLGEAGLKPRLAESRLTGGTRQFLERLAGASWEEMARLRPSSSQMREMEQFLHGFLIYHLGRLPPGRGEALSERQKAEGRRQKLF